ncbi:MAG: hypothetical protein M1830_004000 [Pleopsidium flavum]|nr:MAG: hypothetical protein M1830_004000 [Pleopsidium flavum]
MSIRGERFHVDLSSGDDEAVQAEGSATSAASFDLGLIRDIKEHSPSSTPKPPTAPNSRTSDTGFPTHKKRSKMSTFKQQKGARGQVDLNGTGDRDTNASGASSAILNGRLTQTAPERRLESRNVSSVDEIERQRIDVENNQRLAQMSDDEIERERQELMAGLSPSLLERLLKKANIDDPEEHMGRGLETTKQTHDALEKSSKTKKVTLQPFEPPATATSKAPQQQPSDPDAAPTSPPADLHPASIPHQQQSTSLLLPQSTIHFPQPATPPDLDPSDPSFLTNLHQKYFPTLPSDPSKLAWMSPIPSENSTADQDSPYSPLQQSLPPSSIRFDFRGDLLPPRTARQIPVTKGLHHHGEAAEAAGYTIPELARLARSRYPAQRCVAFQTLGRILYKLGKGVFGDEGSELVMGLWRCVEEGKVLETVQGEANGEGGHVSAKAYAMEAVWLWQKGGGRRWKAG